MKPVPRCECDSKDGNRITEVFADYLPQLRLGIRGLNIKIDCQQSQPNETSYCDNNDKRWLNKTFHNAFQNATCTVRDYSQEGQEQAPYIFATPTISSSCWSSSSRQSLWARVACGPGRCKQRPSRARRRPPA